MEKDTPFKKRIMFSPNAKICKFCQIHKAIFPHFIATIFRKQNLRFYIVNLRCSFKPWICLFQVFANFRQNAN